MNKIFIVLLGLLIITMGVACVAASDNATLNNDSIQTIDQQHIQVDDNESIGSGLNDDVNVVGNSTADTNNNSTSGPKLDIKGPKSPSKLDIKGPKLPFNAKSAASHYNDAFKEISQREYTHGYEKCNIICNLLLEIYKDYNAEQTKQIAYHVLINNHFDITQDEIPYFFEGICGNGVYTYWIGNSPYNYFTKFYDYRKLVESDKYQVSDADLKKCSDYFKKAGDNYDVYEFILFVYKDHNEDMTAKIVSKVLNDGLRGKLGGFFEVGMWDVDYVKCFEQYERWKLRRTLLQRNL